MLHLKRFQYCSLSASVKIKGYIAFPMILDLKPYLVEDMQDTICTLFAVMLHTGKSIHSGHYITYVQSLNNKEWWKMDDTNVSRVNSSKVSMCDAYMLFYRVIDINEDKIKVQATIQEKTPSSFGTLFNWQYLIAFNDLLTFFEWSIRGCVFHAISKKARAIPEQAWTFEGWSNHHHRQI